MDPANNFAQELYRLSRWGQQFFSFFPNNEKPIIPVKSAVLTKSAEVESPPAAEHKDHILPLTEV
jgi:hypothetical protein